MATRRRSEPPRTTPPAVPPAETSAAEPTSPKKSAASTASAPTSGAVRAFGIQSAPERRGFVPGSELEDWLAAEGEVDALLSTAGARQ